MARASVFLAPFIIRRTSTAEILRASTLHSLASMAIVQVRAVYSAQIGCSGFHQLLPEPINGFHLRGIVIVIQRVACWQPFSVNSSAFSLLKRFCTCTDGHQPFLNAFILAQTGFSCMLKFIRETPNHMPTLNWIGKDAVVDHHQGSHGYDPSRGRNQKP